MENDNRASAKWPVGRLLLMILTTALVVGLMVWGYFNPIVRELYFASLLKLAESREEAESPFQKLRALPLPRDRKIRYAGLYGRWIIPGHPADEYDEFVKEMTKEGLARDLVPYMTQSLSQKDLRQRDIVVFRLGHIGPDAEAAVPALVDILQTWNASPDTTDEKCSTIGRIAETLRDIGPASRPAGPALRDACLILAERMKMFHNDNYTDEEKRDRAAFMTSYALGYGLDPLRYSRLPEKEMLPLLRAVFTIKDIHASGHELRHVYTNLALLGRPGADMLLEFAAHPDSELRERAIWGLRYFADTDPRALRAILRAFSDSERNVRKQAASNMYWVRDTLWDNQAAADMLANLFLAEEDLEIRDELLDGVGYTRKTPSSLLPELIRLIEADLLPIGDDDWALRSKENPSPKEQKALENLRRSMLKQTALWVIRYAEQDYARTLPLLFAQLSPEVYEGIRETTCITLSEFAQHGVDSTPIFPKIVGLLEDPEEEVRLEAAWALQHFVNQKDQGIEILRDFIASHPDAGRDRNCAAYALYELTGDHEPLLPVLLTNLTSPRQAEEYQKRQTRWHSLWLLGKLGPKAVSAVPAIRPIAAGARIPPYVSRIDMKDGTVREGMRAAFSLWQITGNTEETLDIFRQNLNCRDPFMYDSILSWIGLMESAAAPLLPRLQEIAFGPEVDCHAEARKAIFHIQHGIPDDY